MMNKLRLTAALSAMLVVVTLTASHAGAASVATPAFPTKPLEIIVGYAAGGANHLAAENLKPESMERGGPRCSDRK